MQDTSHHKDWLKQIAEGDEIAFRNMFDMYWDHIYTVALMLTKSTALAEDIVQEIFLKIWIKREELIAVEKLEGYLFIVARNHIYNVLKKQQKEEQYKKHILAWFETSRDNPEQELLFKESSQLLQQAIGQLTMQQQSIYKLTREQGLSYEQVAEQLNISPHTVRNHMVNSLKTIREYLKVHASPLTMLLALLETLR